MASFTSDTLLDECIDITIVPPSGVDGSEVLDSLAVVKKSTGVARLSKACGDQFSSNTVLATCTTSGTKNVSKSDAGLPPGSYTFDVVERYYDLDALTHSDAYMKNCLDMKGDWDALDKASPQYQQALRARARRELEKAPKALGP